MAISAALLCLAAAAGIVWPAVGCGGGGDSGTGGSGDGPKTTELHPDAPPLPGESECKVVEVTDIPVASATHVAACTSVDYPTNPPSGGNHWAVWAAYKKYTSPVPREMYVHDLEHGAIVLLYRCADACPDVVAALTEVFDAVSDDTCPTPRLILTPDPKLDTPIAAAAWGATYTATCIDVPSLKAFAETHHGHGPEEVCGDGMDVSLSTPCTFPDAGPADATLPDPVTDAGDGG
ncbi:putative membrane protein [Minicystis rosea]|nr:putative membrane protein [Minicystis rosea]